MFIFDLYTTPDNLIVHNFIITSENNVIFSFTTHRIKDTCRIYCKIRIDFPKDPFSGLLITRDFTCIIVKFYYLCARFNGQE